MEDLNCIVMKTADKKLINKKDLPSNKLLEDDFLIEHPNSMVILHKASITENYQKLFEIKNKRIEKSKRERTLFYSISLCLSLLLVIGAFEYNFSTESSTVNISSEAQKFEDLLEVPQTEQPPPPPPKVEQPQIVEVSDEEIVEQDIDIDLDVEVTEDTKIEEQILVDIGGDIEEEKVDEIFTIVEQQPSPVGGMQAFYQYVGENLRYPATASRMNVQGRVFVQFVVEKDGSLTDVQVVKGIGAGCDEEAVRVIQNAPKWAPGKQRGRPVRVRMILPIVFKLVD